jgi:hypothetical protein
VKVKRARVRVKSLEFESGIFSLGCEFTTIRHHRSFSGRGKAALHNRVTDYFFEWLR